MHSAPEKLRRAHDKVPPAKQVLDTFLRALERIPRKDTRDSRREPILEPHYKLLTIVHKMVMRGSIDLELAKETLQHSQFAKKEEFPADRREWIQVVCGCIAVAILSVYSTSTTRLRHRDVKASFDPRIPSGPGNLVDNSWMRPK